MERCKFALPDKIINSKDFIVDQIIPIVIKQNSDKETYSVLFFASSEDKESIYLQLLIKSQDNNDDKFLNSHALNIDKVAIDEKRLEFYKNITADMSSDNLYNCDFDLIENIDEDNFYANGIRIINEDKDSELVKVIFNNDNFIKVNLFIIRLMSYDMTAETVFMNHKLHNIEFVDIDKVKLDASATDISIKFVINHYTLESNKKVYKFNYVSAKIPERVLRRGIRPEFYNNSYSTDFIATDMIYDPHRDYIYVLYEERSSITDKYICTKALRLSKEIYDQTNFMQIDKIYEEK